jgi:hypothetical protein
MVGHGSAGIGFVLKVYFEFICLVINYINYERSR